MIAFPETEYRAKVLKVVDGDTLEVQVDLGFRIHHTIRVRLAGVDTPEIFRPETKEGERQKGRDAKHRVATLVGDRWVVIKPSKGRSFERWNADVYYFPEEGGRVSLGATLVEEGLAEVWDG